MESVTDVRSRKMAKIILVVVAIIGQFCLIEAAVRVYFFGFKKLKPSHFISRLTSDSYYQPLPYRMYGYKPTYRYESSDGKRIHFINSLGLVGREAEQKKKEGVTRIICIGASATANFENSDDAHTYPAQLERALHKELPDQQFEVLNAGVRGYNSAENLIYFSLRLIDFQPDMIVYYEAFNDLLAASYPHFSSDYSHFRRPAWYGLIYKKSWWVGLFEKSCFFLLMRSWLSNYDNAHNVIRYSTLPPPQNPYMHLNFGSTSLNEHGFDIFERNLKSVIAIARMQGIKMVIPTFAHIIHTDKRIKMSKQLQDMLAKGVGGQNDRIRKIWRENSDIIGVDLDQEMSGKSEYFYDFVHFNDAGSQKAGEIISQIIAARLISEK